MDDSADFQVKKGNFITTNRLKYNSDNKKRKKLKGQKDIRTALNPKKSELLRYSKEFNEVCKSSDIDVDSEQLQIAIALSKSLQNSLVEPEVEAHSSKSLSTQDRTSRIRSTLREYGFTVPETKIEKKVKRKKDLKKYKLLNASKFEKQQIITEKYCQVLSDNLHISQKLCQEDTDSGFIYNVATNISYSEIQNIDIFYVKGLLDKAPNSIGTLLKDWLTIPGRPESPPNDSNNCELLNDVYFSQYELDQILSEKLVIAQSIIKQKLETTRSNLSEKNNLETRTRDTDSCMDCDIVEKNKDLNVLNMESLTVNSGFGRSCSPDIFDDEVSSILENSLGQYKSKPPAVETFSSNNDLMDLTECVQQKSQNNTKNIFYQENSVTKWQSNDFMEITNCVSCSSQPIIEVNPLRSKDNKVLPLIIEPEMRKLNEALIDNRCCLNMKVIENIDLTQENLPSPKYTLKSEDMEILDKIDLTQSSESLDALPNINLKYKNYSTNLDDTNVVEEIEYTYVKSPKNHRLSQSNVESMSFDTLGPTDIKTVYSNSEEVLDLAFEMDDNELSFNKSLKKLDSFKTINVIESRKQSENGIHITLKQNLDENKVTSPTNLSAKVSLDSLGKKDNVSIDYDEILYDMPENNSGIIEYVPGEINKESHNYSNQSELCPANLTKTLLCNHVTKSDYINVSQHTEVFEISDNELNDSMQQSKLENQKEHVHVGGVSVFDDCTKSTCKSFCSNRRNRSISESFLPVVDIIKQSEPAVNMSKSQPFTSPKSNNLEVVSTETPNCEYIIKTDQVTPMLDYASLSTPERNNELGKYGLKPFKRKRAIQLLTHLYNQTHPIVETCSESLPKKTKYESHEKITSAVESSEITFSRSNPQCLKDKDNVCYEVTNHVVDIQHSDCDPEDWIFQKKDKAKVHSCRLPLHIAFHNYVSSRKQLQEIILRYEPVHIDVIHKDLVGLGLKYDPKDLLKFMDKKCITVKTVDNNPRNKK